MKDTYHFAAQKGRSFALEFELSSEIVTLKGYSFPHGGRQKVSVSIELLSPVFFNLIESKIQMQQKLFLLHY